MIGLKGFYVRGGGKIEGLPPVILQKKKESVKIKGKTTENVLGFRGNVSFYLEKEDRKV